MTPTNTSCLSINNNSESDAGTSTLLQNVEPLVRLFSTMSFHICHKT